MLLLSLCFSLRGAAPHQLAVRVRLPWRANRVSSELASDSGDASWTTLDKPEGYFVRPKRDQLRTTHRKQAELEKRTAYSAAQSATHSRPEASLKSTLSVGGGADSTSASVLSPSRKLLPGQGAEVTHTRVFATGSVVVGSPALEYAHMGMLAEVRRGKFMVAWQASPDIEGGEEQAIYYTYSKDMLGHEWETPEKLSTGKFAVGQWAPVLHQIGDTTWLFYSENSPKCLRPAQINGKDGETPLAHPIPKRWIIGGSIVVRTRVGIEGLWSNTRVVFSQRMELSIPKLIANRLTVLSTGEWILPFWRQRSTHACASLRTHNNAAGVLITSDGGRTWVVHGNIVLAGGKNKWLIEGTVAELEDGNITMLLRSTEGYVYRADSKDRGVTWGDPRQTMLVNPDSKIASLVLADGRLLVAFNDQQARNERAEDEAAGGAKVVKRRDTLCVAISEDGGETLRIFARLDDGKSGMMVHYPTMVVPSSDPGRLLVTYTRSYNNRTAHATSNNGVGGLEDGIWIAEMALPVAGAMELIGAPIRSLKMTESF